MWVTEWQGKARIGLRSEKKLFYRLLIRPWLIPGETAEQVRDVNSSGGAHRPQLFILATLIFSLPSLCPHWCARCSRSHWKLRGGKKTENPRSEKILRGLFFWPGWKQNRNSAAWIRKCPGVRCPNVYSVQRTETTFEKMIYPHNLIHHLRRSPADEKRFWTSNRDSDHCDFDKYYILAILDTKDKSESWRYRLWKFVLML